MRTHRLSWFWLSAALAAHAAGCADTATCNPNEILYAGSCMPAPMPDPDAAASNEAQGAESVDAGAGDATLTEAASTEGATSGGDAGDEH